MRFSSMSLLIIDSSGFKHANASSAVTAMLDSLSVGSDSYFGSLLGIWY